MNDLTAVYPTGDLRISIYRRCLGPKYLYFACPNRHDSLGPASGPNVHRKRTEPLHHPNTINSADKERRSCKPLADMAATASLREALNQGISSGNLVDTKIILYSHRDSFGRVCRPKVLHATSQVLKTIPYFNNREFTATLDIARKASYKSKCSSGTSQSPS